MTRIFAMNPKGQTDMKKSDIAAMIDHTLLKATATKEQIAVLCREAKEYTFASVCVNPFHVAYAAELLKDSGVKVCTVIGFPLGANTSAVKAFETVDAVKNGADEIDMVVNVGLLKAHDEEGVYEDILSVVKAASGKLVKVIIETCYLTDDEKVMACRAAVRAGANFVKTSTGFGTGGATVHDVQLMRENVPENMSVKASGGIHTYEEALALIEAGAGRIGASAGIQITRDAE